MVIIRYNNMQYVKSPIKRRDFVEIDEIIIYSTKSKSKYRTS